MASISSRNNKLVLDFRYKGQRYREQTALKDNKDNRKKVDALLGVIEAEITLNQLDYAKHFPDSNNLERFLIQENRTKLKKATRIEPLLKDFSLLWFDDKKIEWRRSHRDKIQIALNRYILPKLGNKVVSDITRSDILEFRSKLGKVTKRNGEGLSASRINQIMSPLSMMLHDAADRYNFTSPYHGIKALKIQRTDVYPFSLDEVKLMIDRIRKDFRPYLTTRFFTGMRSAEINGLKWDCVDFERKQILVRESVVNGKTEYVKNDGSYRSIEMSSIVTNALKEQEVLSRTRSEYVFCNNKGLPINPNNFRKRVWLPLLRNLDLKKRTPYQTRHTAATLWLAAGESPEWIARQMGHTTTEMLFRVYSRYVPNLTRQDGSAFENLLLSTGIIETNLGEES